MKIKKITAACRNAVADVSGYYTTRCEAVHGIQDLLETFSHKLDQLYFWDMANNEGRITVDVENTNSMLVLSWYRMPLSGRFEIVSYLS